MRAKQLFCVSTFVATAAIVANLMIGSVNQSVSQLGQANLNRFFEAGGGIFVWMKKSQFEKPSLRVKHSPQLIRRSPLNGINMFSLISWRVLFAGMTLENAVF